MMQPCVVIALILRRKKSGKTAPAYRSEDRLLRDEARTVFLPFLPVIRKLRLFQIGKRCAEKLRIMRCSHGLGSVLLSAVRGGRQETMAGVNTFQYRPKRASGGDPAGIDLLRIVAVDGVLVVAVPPCKAWMIAKRICGCVRLLRKLAQDMLMFDAAAISSAALFFPGFPRTGTAHTAPSLRPFRTP